MTTHVFIVNSITFKLHLEYLFAGTGADDRQINFNNSQIGAQIDIHHTAENMLVSMMADASRVRRGDQIIFYLQQDGSKKIFEGKFYGIFRAVNDCSFLDNNDENQYLRDDLKKSLTFRTLIEPFNVYPEGVTEWEALDEIRNIQSPNQMLWSLIYRKLKGNRGNTMITTYEAERLCQLIRNKNSRNIIDIDGHQLSFDQENQRIILTGDNVNQYNGRQEPLILLSRLITKYNRGQAFESHLQAYIVGNIGKGTNNSLDSSILGQNPNLEWLGNEVSCGVGMQRIDVMVSITENSQRVLIPIELKSVKADIINVIQIQRYIDWIEQYYIPNRQSDINPVLISKKVENKQTQKYNDIINTFNDFNSRNSGRCGRLKYIEYNIENNNLVFEVIPY